MACFIYPAIYPLQKYRGVECTTSGLSGPSLPKGKSAAESGLSADGRSCFLRLGSGRFRRELFPIATFFNACAHRSNLRFFLDDERRAALRARFRDRLERRREIAIRVARAAVENPSASAPANASAADKLAFMAF